MKKTRLTDKEKVFIINNYYELKLKEIAFSLKRPIITIKKFHQRWREREMISNKKSFNQPKLRNLDFNTVIDYLIT